MRALKDARFDVRRGEVQALIGENGAGKSTLIKIVSGVYQPDKGEIWLDGRRVDFSNPREAHLAGIATIYQELGLYPELSVAENIFMGHAPRTKRLGFETIDWEAMEAGAEALLADLNIENLDVGAKVGALNVGNRQRVEIAKALSLDAQILIMDEPTAALTESDVEQLFSIVRLLRERGVSIIYISHRLNEVFELADRVTVLRDGEYIGTRAAAETNEAELISMMVGRRIENLFPKQAAAIGDVVLEARNLNRPPLTRDISFQVRAGEIVGLAGLVGAGRSETAQVIFGVLPAESGEILLNGEAVKITRPSEAVDYGIGYVPEDRGHQGLIRENTSMAVLETVSQKTFVNRTEERRLANRSFLRKSISHKISTNLSLFSRYCHSYYSLCSFLLRSKRTL